MAKILKIPLLVLILLFWFSYWGNSQGSNGIAKVEKGKKESLINILGELEEEHKVYFAYQKKYLVNKFAYYEKCSKKNIGKYLGDLLAPLDLTVRKVENVLIIQPAESLNAAQEEKRPAAGQPEAPLTNPVKIRGKVVSAVDHEPLQSVTVLVRETQTGAVTDIDGNYVLDVPPDATLVFSFIGYQRKEVAVEDRAVIDMSLELDVTQLSEIVVTALGLQKDAISLTYAQQSIDGEELTRVKDANVMNSLAGKAAGVIITGGAGGPGSSTKVLMRGNKSILGSNSPLYVINGIPMNNVGGPQSTSLNYTRDGGDAISNLNPEDIAGISILKGASAAALYGSQAANGVILITTKKGKEGVSEVHFSSSTTISEPMVLPRLQSSYGRGIRGEAFDRYLPVNDSWGPAISHGRDDHLEEFFKTGKTFINSLSVTSGNEAGQYYLSYANTSASGIVPEHDYNRHNFTIRGTTELLNEKISLDASVNYAHQATANMPSAGWYNSPIFGLYLFPVGDDFSKYKSYESWNALRDIPLQNWPYIKNEHSSNQNPYWIQHKIQSDNIRERGIYSLSANWEMANWLNLTVRGTYDQIQDTYERRESAGSDPTSVGLNGGYEKRLTNTAQLYSDLLLTGRRELTDHLHIMATAGFSNTYNEYYDLSLGNNEATNTLSYPNFFSVHALTGDFISTESLQKRFTQALFGTATIGYKETIFLDISGRNEWSSTVNDDFFYPFAGISYVLTQTWGSTNFLSFAKIRASYAEVGNALAFGVSNWNPPYSLAPNNNINGRENLPFFSGSDTISLEPERSRSYELGLDVRLFKDKLALNLTYYNAITDNQLLRISAPAGSGASNFFLNGGKIRNKGIEAVLSYHTHLGPVEWRPMINFSRNVNHIIELSDLLPTDRFVLNNTFRLTQLFLLRPDSELLGNREYGSYGDIFGRTYIRNDNGDIQYYDHDKNPATADMPKLSDANDQYAGNFNPDFLAGFNNQFRYRNFTLSFLIDSRWGGDVVSSTEQWLDFKGLSERSGNARDAGGVMVGDKRVSAETYYKYISGNADVAAAAEEYIFDATNVRLREFSLGYTLPKFSNTIKDLSLSLIGRNLFFLYKKAPFDPEVSITTANSMQGIEGFNLPTTRSYGVKVSATF